MLRLRALGLHQARPPPHGITHGLNTICYIIASVAGVVGVATLINARLGTILVLVLPIGLLIVTGFNPSILGLLIVGSALTGWGGGFVLKLVIEKVRRFLPTTFR